MQFRSKTVKPVMLELGRLKRAMETGWNVGTTSLKWTGETSDAAQWTNGYRRISQIGL